MRVTVVKQNSYPPKQNSSKPHGKVLLHVEQKFYPVEFMVVESKNPIIGLSMCENLNLVRFVDEIKQSDVRSAN